MKYKLILYRSGLDAPILETEIDSDLWGDAYDMANSVVGDIQEALLCNPPYEEER